jgi:hypothetical protein
MKTTKLDREEPPISHQNDLVYVSPEGGLPRVYANSFQFAQSESDVRITFAETVNVDPNKVGGSTYTMQQRTVVTVSWLHLKAMADHIKAMVTAFESRNGELIWPCLTPQPGAKREAQPSEPKPTLMN